MGRPKGMFRKTQLNTRIRKETAQFLREKFVSPAAAVEDFGRFLMEAEEMVTDAFNALTHEFTAVTEISPKGPVAMPGITLFDRIDRGIDEKVILSDLLHEGTWKILKRKNVAIGSNFYHVWGKQLGKALGLDTKACLVLGEFCGGWMSRKGSRMRNLSPQVEKFQRRFIEVIDDKSENRKPFDRSNKGVYSQAWNSLLNSLQANSGPSD